MSVCRSALNPKTIPTKKKQILLLLRGVHFEPAADPGREVVADLGDLGAGGPEVTSAKKSSHHHHHLGKIFKASR